MARDSVFREEQDLANPEAPLDRPEGLPDETKATGTAEAPEDAFQKALAGMKAMQESFSALMAKMPKGV